MRQRNLPRVTRLFSINTLARLNRANPLRVVYHMDLGLVSPATMRRTAQDGLLDRSGVQEACLVM